MMDKREIYLIKDEMMKSKIYVIAVFSLFCVNLNAEYAAKYELVDLGAVEGCSSNVATSINNNNIICGWSHFYEYPDIERGYAVLFNIGAENVILGSGNSLGYASYVNDSGQIFGGIGYGISSDNVPHGFIFDPCGNDVNLAPLAFTNCSNEADMIGGYRILTNPTTQTKYNMASIMTYPDMSVFSVGPENMDSFVNSINLTGKAVGYYRDDSYRDHAVQRQEFFLSTSVIIPFHP